jgi:hypothetical protein
MDERMPGCTSLDFTEANEISALKVAVPVTKLPQR